MLKRARLVGYVTVLAAIALPARAVTVAEVPNPRTTYGGWVTDMADILPPETEAALNRRITHLESQTGAEIAVVTVPTTAPAATPQAFATELFNTWGIGKAGRNNGVLFLVSVGDRRTEIETGYGLQSILPDHRVAAILERDVIPSFKAGRFDQGILRGTQSMVVILGSADAENAILSALIFQPLGIKLLLLGSGIVGIMAYRLVAKRRRQPLYVLAQTIRQRGPDPDQRVIYALALVGAFGLLFTAGGVVWVMIDPAGQLWLAGLIAGGVGCWPVSWGVNQLLGSRAGGGVMRPLHCERCRQAMTLVGASQLQSYLTQPQTVACQLGSLRVNGWYCRRCRPNLLSHTGGRPEGFHIRISEPLFSRYGRCPNGRELTVRSTSRTLVQATEYSTGTRLVIEDCQCCNYHHERQETIPRKTSSSTSSGSSSSSSSSGSFGGGSSGGGGAGASW